jgi:hypothetical protein
MKKNLRILIGILTYGAEPFLRSCNSAAIQKIPSNFKEPEGSSPCSQEPSTGPYPEPVQSILIGVVSFFLLVI